MLLSLLSGAVRNNKAPVNDPHQGCDSLDTRGPAARTPHEPSHVLAIPATTTLVAVPHYTRPPALASASSRDEPTPAPHSPCPRPRQSLPTWATWATAASLWPLWAPCPPHLSAERYPPHTLSPTAPQGLTLGEGERQHCGPLAHARCCAQPVANMRVPSLRRLWILCLP